MSTITPQLQGDPFEMLDAQALGKLLGGVTAEEVHARRARRELFAVVLMEHGTEPRYPAFQAWPGIAGAPLLEVLNALRSCDGTGAYFYLVGRSKELGQLSPAEILVGWTTLPPEKIEPTAVEILAMPAERRRRGVVAFAKAFAIDAAA